MLHLIDGQYMLDVSDITSEIESNLTNAQTCITSGNAHRADGYLTRAWGMLVLMRPYFAYPALNQKHSDLCVALIELERKQDQHATPIKF